MDIAISKNGIPIRLTDERWHHISTGHPEIADYFYEILESIENPDYIYQETNGARIAVKNFQKIFPKFVVVIYKETDEKDGFIITAHFSKMEHKFTKKKVIWKKQN